MVTSETERRAAGELLGPSPSLLQDLLFRHHTVVETDLLGARAASMKSPVIRSSHGTPETDDPRQQPGGSHVGPGQPDLGEKVGDAGIFGGDPQITGGSDDRASARHLAVERGEDRPAATQHGEDQRPGATGEVEQALKVAARTARR